jgi:hypothetical protein
MPDIAKDSSATLIPYPQPENWRSFIAELPAGFADFRKIKGSDTARGGRSTPQ